MTPVTCASIAVAHANARKRVLVSLGAAELNDILAAQGTIDITCQFCNQQYQFDAIDVAQMLHSGSPGGGRLH
jgi:hypothetical protein